MSPDDVLGVARGASESDVKSAFRRFAQAHHPDRGGDPATFQQGMEAYRAITRPRVPRADVVTHRRPIAAMRCRRWIGWAMPTLGRRLAPGRSVRGRRAPE